MSTLDIITDAPGTLRAEAINITLKFERTGPSTGRVSWNIPTPAAGCAAGTQAYCGMVVTIDNKPTSLDKTPKNGTFYNSDPTVDANLFAGDKLGGSAFVVGAFYQDRTTTFFDVDGLMPNTPYFVTGFPADCQGRYFIEGVHAYSQDFTNRGTDGTSGSQVVALSPHSKPHGAKPTDNTGLMPGIKYDFNIQVGLTPKPNRPVSPTECSPASQQHTINIDGTKAQTYEELVGQINKQLALIQNCAQGPFAPNTGAYYFNTPEQRLFRWTGSAHEELPVIIGIAPPDDITVGSYWINPKDNTVSMWNGSAWNHLNVVSYDFDPTSPKADTTYWFDGTTAYLWNGNTWCVIETFVQVTDPADASAPTPGSYWKDGTGDFYKWNADMELWQTVAVVEAAEDPNAFAVGSFWFDDVGGKLMQYEASGWTASTNVTVSENAPRTPGPDKKWYNPTTHVLNLRNDTNDAWVVTECVTFSMDPTKRNFCDLWLNTSENALFIWNGLKRVWVQVTRMYDQPNDPSVAQHIQDGAAWYNPDDAVLQIRSGLCWKPVDYINWPTDPLSDIGPSTIWHDVANGTWKIRVNDQWVDFNATTSEHDPKQLPTGTFWYNPDTLGLSFWNGMSWVGMLYNTTPQNPPVGQCWYDTSTQTLKEWNGNMWTRAIPAATAELDCNGNILFTDTTVGSQSYIWLTDGSLFKSLDLPNEIVRQVPGTDGASDVPSYEELGVGTDGSDAVRSEIANEIRYELGYPIITVELAKEQIDYAITKALGVLRTMSSIPYKREFFFMRLKTNEQKFYLTNKIQGMNKIVDILGVYRMNSAVMSSAHGAGVYGQIVMQHMYNMGTFDLLSFHLMGEYTSLMERLFATRITFNWNEQTRLLQMYQRFSAPEPMVLIETAVERTEQDIMTDRYARTWIRNYAAATCRLMLAESRGKFSTVPGAGGAVSLNSSDLRQAANDQIALCMQEIADYVVNKPDEFGAGTEIVFG